MIYTAHWRKNYHIDNGMNNQQRVLYLAFSRPLMIYATARRVDNYQTSIIHRLDQWLNITTIYIYFSCHDPLLNKKVRTFISILYTSIVRLEITLSWQNSILVNERREIRCIKLSFCPRCSIYVFWLNISYNMCFNRYPVSNPSWLMHGSRKVFQRWEKCFRGSFR